MQPLHTPSIIDYQSIVAVFGLEIYSEKSLIIETNRYSIKQK